jgi:hypothetical protein
MAFESKLRGVVGNIGCVGIAELHNCDWEVACTLSRTPTHV